MIVYTLEQTKKNIRLIKFYSSEGVRNTRKGKNWESKSYITEMPEFISKGINNGNLEKPKFLVKAGDLEVPVFTEGVANTLMENLTKGHREVTVVRLSEDDSDGDHETEIDW